MVDRVSGHKTLDDIERAIDAARAKEAKQRQTLETDNARKADVLKRRATAIRDLAETRARSAIADGVIDEADRLDREVGLLLETHIAGAKAMEADRAALRAERSEALKTADDARATLETLEQELDRVADAAREALAADPDHEARTSKATEIAEQIKRATAKTERAEEDRVTKSKPYKGDPLFMYLWDRRFGTREYNKTGLIHYLDEKVADLVGFREARANYAMLNEIPVRLAEHCAQLKTQQDALDTEIARTEAAATAERLRKGFDAELNQARADSQSADASVATITSRIAEVENRLTLHAQGQDEPFRQAIQTLSVFLEADRLNALREQARATQSPADDVIVANIGTLNQELANAEIDIAQRRADLQSTARRLTELEGLAANFRRRSYHHPGSVIVNDGQTDWMRMLAEGVLTVAEIWLRMQANQRWRSRSGDPFRRSSGLPPFGGGTYGRGGSSRGSWGGKDFRTDGGF